MFRSRIVTVLLALMVFVGSPALAGEQDFELQNSTGVDIYKVFVSPSGAADWQEDVLGVDVLLDGEAVVISFDRSETAAHWDIRVEDDEGNALMWGKINLLEASHVQLLPDGTAEIE